MHFVMIFLDGFGLGRNQDNPIVAANTPYIDALLGGHYLWGERTIRKDKVFLTPLDASLDVSGVPQSATGQTTLWTGVNAAKILGYHLNAYPNERLIEVIEDKSIFKQLAKQGKRVMFANAFTDHYEEDIASGKKRYTASTLSALAGGVRLRRLGDLLEGKGVYQDMTNELLRQQGKEVPIISAFQAGQNLSRLALDYDFTLYEFFQTDVRGHKRNWEEAIKLVEQIDEFIGGFIAVAREKKVTLLLTSDHGNVEDFMIKGHTHNPVPALGWTNCEVVWPSWSKLEEVTPGIIKLISS
jgi:2,3-bisphosphoglycerate-independent phosphoglycerate mutase